MRNALLLMMSLTPLSAGSSLLSAPVEVKSAPNRLVLSQEPRTAYKVVTYGWLFIVACMLFATYHDFFTKVPTTLTCDRASGTCTLNQWGGDHPLPPLGQITGADLEWEFGGSSRGSGPSGYRLVLKLAGGAKETISPRIAVAAAPIAEYRAASEAIRAFLADPAQPRLTTRFTYRAGVMEKLSDVFNGAIVLVFLLVILSLFSAQSYAFDRGGEVVLSKRRLGITVARRAIAGDQIVAIVDKQVAVGREIELKLADGSDCEILRSTTAAETGVVDGVVKALHEILAKPVEAQKR